MAVKTGILDISDQGIRTSSAVWTSIVQDNIHTRISVLDLSRNPLKVTPVEVYTMTNMKILTLSQCNLQRLDDMIALDRLTQLTIDHNDLEADVINTLPDSLIKLNISFNHLASFPALKLNNLIHLVELDLSSNRMSTIYGIDALVSLVILNLNNNLLTDLSTSIDFLKLCKLKRLSCTNNQISKRNASNDEQSIAKDLFVHTLLENLELQGNKLSKSDVLGMEGVEYYIDRRKKLKDKSFHGGTITDFNLFGLD